MSRLYRALLLAYPASFRARFGRAMLRAFEEELVELRARGGLAPTARVLVRTVRDALATAVQMRWARWRGRPGPPLSSREELWRIGRAVGRRTPGAGKGPRKSGGRGQTRGFALVDALLIDLRLAVRTLRRNPGFASVAVLTLAIGIGANTTIFSVVDGLLLQPLPVSEPDRLVTLTSLVATDEGGLAPFAVSAGNFTDWKERNGAFSGMSATFPVSATLGEGEGTLELQGLRVSANFFDVLGVPAALGRTFRPDEDPPDSPAVVVIGHGLWQRAFGGDPSVIGRDVLLSGAPHTIIGIAPEGFSFVGVMGPNVFSVRDYWTLDPFGRRGPRERQYRMVGVVARLEPGISIEQAREEMSAVAGALADEYPDTNRNRLTGQAHSVSITNYHLFLVGGLRPALWMLVGAVAFVLAIACTNVANLLLVRATARRREVAVRVAIGAGRWRLIRQMLTESVLLAAAGGVGGILIAWLTIPTLVSMAPDATPAVLLENIDLDGRALVFTVLTALAAVAAFGVAPALRFAGSGPGPALRGVAETEGHRRRWPARQLAVATQIALALVLLVGIGLLVTTFARLYSIPLGFDPDGVYGAWTTAPRAAATASEAGAPVDAVREIIERLEAHPDIEAAGAVNMLPLWGNYDNTEVRIDGRPGGVAEADGVGPTVNDVGQPDRALLRAARPGYFHTLRIPLLRGRDLSWSDDASSPRVAVINEALAETYFAGENPLGRHVTIIGRRAPTGEPLGSVEIVGVVGDLWELSHYMFNRDYTGPAFLPTIYIPSPVNTFVARFTEGAETGPEVLRTVISELDPKRGIVQLDSVEHYVDQMLVAGELRLSAVVIGALAVVSFLLALMGVYGTMAFHVASRTHEIGVRMALGSRAGTIVGMIVGQGLRLAALGALGGVLLALATTHLLSRWLYEVSPTDPLTFASLSIVMVAVAVLACWIPARRAAWVDPMTSLRAE